jgi:outer membrane protein W
MMKKILLQILALIISIQVLAQSNKGPMNSKGSSLITIGYGIGNIWVYLLEHNSFFIDYVSNYNVKSTGPISICYENFLSKKISLGMAVSYSIVKGKGDGRGVFVDDQISMFTALIRGNYHFGKSLKFDSYVGGGIGYIRSVYKSFPSVPSPAVPGEFGYSAQVGAHYYLTKNAGFYGELGYVNGSFLQLGGVVRF